MPKLDVTWVRRQFPALTKEVAGKRALFLDGPAGSQVPTRVIDAVSHYLAFTNANTHGAFSTARDSDDLLQQAHAACADFVGSHAPEQVVFGPNMTTLTFALSRAMAKTWSAGDEVIVTRLDHDANITPWVLAARDAGATVKHIPFHTSDTTLDLDAFEEALSPRTRLVAVGAASNATGTINPLASICQAAHDVGATVFVDAVHYAPHGLIDVQAWNCDFVACSAYKFFGPHVGMLWGKHDAMAHLPAYRLRPVGDALPDRWMTGTQNHEGIAGLLAAIDYIAEIGRRSTDCSNRRDALRAAFDVIVQYERALARQLLDGLATIEGVKIYGICDEARMHQRAPTVSFTHPRLTPRAVAEALGEQGIFVWDGNYYAVDVTESLGLEPEGMVRVGLLHYNTVDEVARFVDAVRAL